nr:immunoglobulin light chain junction region [Macaca mulatta]
DYYCHSGDGKSWVF